jgi:hypothetical protein
MKNERIHMTIWTPMAVMALFACVVNAADGDFRWAKGMGALYIDEAEGIAVDGAGNAYMVGAFQETVNFDTGLGACNLTSAGSFDIFVLKLDGGGNLVWARAMGGANRDEGIRIAVDNAGNVYTTGYFNGTADFDPGPDAYNLTAVGQDDIFISKLDSSGNFVWAKAMGGTNDESGSGIALDSAGNVYITGYFDGKVDFDPGPEKYYLTSAGLDDIFISKLDSNGDFVWAKAMGGTSVDDGVDIAVDSTGNIYITGLFTGTVDFDPGAGTYNLTAVGHHGIFVSKLDTAGNFVWAKAMGGQDYLSTSDAGTAIAVDSAGNVYTTGRFCSTVDFDPGPGTYNLTSAGMADIFVSRLDTNGNFIWAKAMGGTGIDSGSSIAVDGRGNVYTTGNFSVTADFDPGLGIYPLEAASTYFTDIFVSKLDNSGNFLWAKAMGGADGDYGLGIAVDSGANVYTAGFFADTVDFDPGPGTFNLVSAGDGDIFVSKFSGPSPTGTIVINNNRSRHGSYANAL